MKAFLLAGGLGSRLGNLAAGIPKCMVDIDGTPLLEIWLDLCELHGITDVLLNVSRHADVVEAFLRQRRGGVNVILAREDQPIGNAGTLLAHQSFVQGEASFYIIYSDNLTRANLSALFDYHQTHRDPLTMGLFHTPNPSAAGIVQLDAEGVITRFAEKPTNPTSDLANAGIYVARPSVFESIPRTPNIIDFGHHVLPRLIGRMRGFVIREYLIDIGTPASLTRARLEWRP